MTNTSSSEDEFLRWAALQPIRYGLIGGRRARLPEEQQAESRLALARGMARNAFGSDEIAEAWLTTPSPELGGLSPGDLVAEGDEGSRLALMALVRQHRRQLSVRDG